jgi:hypothetical protein
MSTIRISDKIRAANSGNGRDERLTVVEDAMEKEDITRMYEWIQSRVRLVPDCEEPVIAFDAPTPEAFREQGFDEELTGLTLGSPWWPEMVTDIIETPEFAEPDEPPDVVLQYARDVVKEYVWKRLDP